MDDIDTLFKVAGAVLPAADYATALAETARGADAMRSGVQDRVAAIARSGEEYDGSNRHSALIEDVTTIAMIDAACKRPPVRLIYSRAYTPPNDDDGV